MIILFVVTAVMFTVFGLITLLGHVYSLNGIKSRTVGDGQHGTARWATKAEIRGTYVRVPFIPDQWRRGKDHPIEQGIVVGCESRRGQTYALVDTGDVHVLMIGAAGVGKTAYWLYPCIEYAMASGMSYLSVDTKGDVLRSYGRIARDCYGYRLAVLDLRNPSRSYGNNLLFLVNKYTDIWKQEPDNLTARAKAEKYAKIIAKTIILSGADASSFGTNAYFYDAAEGLLTAAILLVVEFCLPEKRHIVSVFKIIQELQAPGQEKGKNQFQLLMEQLPPDHKARWFAGAALNTSEQAVASVLSTALSRLNAFLDSSMEQILCFDPVLDAEQFCKEKSALFLILPEENPTTFFLVSLFIQQFYREILSVADEYDGKLPNRVVFFCDELGTMPAFDILPLFSAGRSRRLTLVPIIQSIAQLEKNYSKEGAEILLDNCQDTIFGGFAPNSQTAEVLSKALGNRTVLSGSISRGKNDPSQSLQMIERPLMTPDELKSIPKGHFLVMKTGTHPMQTRLRLFLEWGITFGEPYQVSQQAARKVYYASKAELTDVIYRAFPASARQNNYRTPKKEKTIP